MSSLCIDFGSTFVKFFVYDGKNIVFSDRLNFPEPCINNGVDYEVSIQDINHLVLEIFKKTKELNVKKCFIAVQMHGYVLKQYNGEFSNYVSWKDKRGDISNPLLQSIDFEINGTSLKNNLPAVKLLRMKSECEFFTLGSYIASLLTGRNITHKTDGCASGFFDVETLKPSGVINPIVLPETTHRVLPIGVYEGIEIYTPVGDQQLSYLGSEEEDAYLLNIGSATQVATLSDQYEKSTDFEKRPYFNNYRLLTVSGLTGGEILFDGYSIEAFSKEVLSALKKLPVRRKMLVGGGGAELVYAELKEYLKDYNIECIKLEKNISEEGFKRIIKCVTQK